MPLGLDESGRITYERSDPPSISTQSTYHINDTTHISETNLLSSAVSTNQETNHPSPATRSGSQSIHIDASVPAAMDLDSKHASSAASCDDDMQFASGATQRGLPNTIAGETSYGLIPSCEARKLLGDLSQAAISVVSNESEMPDPTASTSSKLPRKFDLSSHQGKNAARDVLEDVVVRSSAWSCFAGSNQRKGQSEQTPPAAQGE